MCGKSIRGSLLCGTCEKEVLEKQKSRKLLLSGILIIATVGIVYFLWNEYQARQSQVDLSIVSRAYTNLIGSGKGILASPFLFVPAIVLLLVVAFLIGTKLAK
jgi:hypothetical protein